MVLPNALTICRYICGDLYIKHAYNLLRTYRLVGNLAHGLRDVKKKVEHGQSSMMTALKTVEARFVLYNAAKELS